MTDPHISTPAPSDDSSKVPDGPPPPALGALPELRVPLEPVEIVRRLDALARRGKLAGFEPGKGDVLFAVECFGEPFERRLEARASRDGGQTVLRFSAPLLLKVPIIYVAVVALTIWPGEWLTHSMLTTYFSWYKIETWWWYLPVTIVPLFWMIPRAARKSEAMCRVSASEQIAAIHAALTRA